MQPRTIATAVALPAGNARPVLAFASRGRGHRMRSATNEMSSANAAPYMNSQSGSGRSLRPPTPWARTWINRYETLSSTILRCAFSSSTSNWPGMSAVKVTDAELPAVTSTILS